MAKVTEVRPLGGHVLHLTFDDGREGTIDFAEWWTFRGVFAPLRDPAMFAQVHILPDFGTLAWPGDVDVDPNILYHRATGAPLPSWATPTAPAAPSPAA